jgi:iron complex outermembrane receptor protein
MLKYLALFLTAGLASGLWYPAPAPAQEYGEVRLGAVEVTAPKDTINTITQTEIERKSAQNIWQALSGVPGVTLSQTGDRNENLISIRGSNDRQVGLYVDDIAIATTYRNQYDFNNVLVFDLETIEISKGYSSMLLNGGFGLSGTLNARTHKPTRPLEFKVQYINYFDRKADDQGRFMGVRVGTKQDLFYVQASVVQDEQKFFTLSRNFRPGYFESGGRRVNSDYRNRRLNFIAGLTPTETTDIMFGMVLQDFNKGQPVTAQMDVSSTQLGTGFPPANATRLWRWPEYETKRYFINANAAIGDKTHVQLVAYLDKHKDVIQSYEALNGKKPALPMWDADSGYEQYVGGIRGRVDYEINPAHKVSLSVGYRESSHKEVMKDTKVVNAHIKDHYWDLGGEYTYKPIDRLTAILGLSYSRRTPDLVKRIFGNSLVSMESGDMESNEVFNYQLGLFYDLTNSQQIFATYSKKSRFPSMWERYTALNRYPPYVAAVQDLESEEADHFEIGYRGTIDGWFKFSTSVFYSRIKDKIVRDASSGLNVFHNVDQVKTYGFEAGLDMTFNQYVTVGGTASLINWSVQTNTANQELLPDTPRVQGSFYGIVSPMPELSVTAQGNMRTNFYNSSNPAQAHNKTPGFFTADLKISYDFNEHITAEFGAKNIFDKNYYYSWYFPQPGRTFFLGVTGTY